MKKSVYISVTCYSSTSSVNIHNKKKNRAWQQHKAYFVNKMADRIND